MNKNLTVITPQIAPLLPALIAREDERTAERFIDFFAVTIRNLNMRAAYMRAVGQFLGRCEERNTKLSEIKSFIVAAYIE